MQHPFHLFALAVAGALGTLSRYGVGRFADRLGGASYPWGTFTVNVFGSFLFGVLFALLESRIAAPHWKMILLTGFLGGFTTFSAFAAENQRFLVQREWMNFSFHFIGQNLLGIVAVFAGIYLIETFFASNPPV